MGKLTTQESWNQTLKSENVTEVTFSEIFTKYMKGIKVKSCIEIGCYPGKFLAYLAKMFDCKAVGVDYVKGAKKITEETLNKSGVKEYEVYEADFFNWEPPQKYDLVSSFGFIEHFVGDTLDSVLQKHLSMLTDGGCLLLEIPNYRGVRYLKSLLFNRVILREHNLNTMRLSFFQKIVNDNGLKLIYLNYYGGGLIGTIRRAFERIVMRKDIVNIKPQLEWEENCNDWFFSRSIILIAMKPK